MPQWLTKLLNCTINFGALPKLGVADLQCSVNNGSTDTGTNMICVNLTMLPPREIKQQLKQNIKGENKKEKRGGGETNCMILLLVLLVLLVL